VSQEAEEVAPGWADASQARPHSLSGLTRSRHWLGSNLFLETARGPIGWRRAALAVIFVLAGAAISLTRTVGVGSLNTIWIEDANFLLSQGLFDPLSQVLQAPISNYYQEPARIFTAIALEFPLTWVPGLMAIFAALQYAMYGLVAYIASGPHLRSPWLRMLVAAPACMIPLAYTQANNDLVTVQFFGLYGAFWVLLWRPASRGGKIFAPIVMVTVSFTASLSLVFAPLVVIRLFVDRSRTSIAIAAAWLLGALLEFKDTLAGRHVSQHLSHDNSVLHIAKAYIGRVVPRALFGERSLGGPGVTVTGTNAPLHITNLDAHYALIAAAWLVVLVVLALALARFTRPNWPLMVTAAIFGLGIFTEELLVNVPVIQPRYTIAPALLLYAVMVAALRPKLELDPARVRKALRILPIAGFTVLLAVAVTLNFRVVNGRTSSPPWTSVVAAARAACVAQPSAEYYHYAHEWWWVNIPCSRFRDYWQGKTAGTTSFPG
jgi:hypothetical protein